MSEQYRCSECGHFVEIPDDAICDVCNIGIMEHLRYTKGGDGSHWDGCEEVHWDCKIAQLEAELARRDEIITRLKEVLPTLKISHNYCEDCWYSCPKHEDGCCNEAEGEDCNCGADEHNAIIDALMKELE